MNQIIMKALITGAAGLVAAFFEKAKKQGLSIMLLVLVSVGLLWAMREGERECAAEMKALRRQMEARQLDWMNALNQSRIDLIQCDEKREQLALRVAVLEANNTKNKRSQ